MRSLHPANAVHKGFGTIPTSILQRKNGVCIYGRPACYGKLFHRPHTNTIIQRQPFGYILTVMQK